MQTMNTLRLEKNKWPEHEKWEIKKYKDTNAFYVACFQRHIWQ